MKEREEYFTLCGRPRFSFCCLLLPVSFFLVVEIAHAKLIEDRIDYSFFSRIEIPLRFVLQDCEHIDRMFRGVKIKSSFPRQRILNFSQAYESR